jgi:hypothetical protein
MIGKDSKPVRRRVKAFDRSDWVFDRGSAIAGGQRELRELNTMERKGKRRNQPNNTHAMRRPYLLTPHSTTLPSYLLPSLTYILTIIPSPFEEATALQTTLILQLVDG